MKLLQSVLIVSDREWRRDLRLYVWSVLSERTLCKTWWGLFSMFAKRLSSMSWGSWGVGSSAVYKEWLGPKVNFAPGKIPSGSKSHRKWISSAPGQETAKYRAKFGWPPVSDVAAVMKPTRETSWNLLGCHKLANRPQPLVGQSKPYCEDVWRRYCCLTSFFRLSIHALATKI